MSADMMIICKEDDSSFEGNNTDKAFKIDETSMGEPWTEFGKWFGQRYCGAPDMLEQMRGIHEHKYSLLHAEDIVLVRDTLKEMKHSVDVEKLLIYLLDHVGKHISTENW